MLPAKFQFNNLTKQFQKSTNQKQELPKEAVPTVWYFCFSFYLCIANKVNKLPAEFIFSFIGVEVFISNHWWEVIPFFNRESFKCSVSTLCKYVIGCVLCYCTFSYTFIPVIKIYKTFKPLSLLQCKSDVMKIQLWELTTLKEDNNS